VVEEKRSSEEQFLFPQQMMVNHALVIWFVMFLAMKKTVPSIARPVIGRTRRIALSHAVVVQTFRFDHAW
jgi:hypothetical protein